MNRLRRLQLKALPCALLSLLGGHAPAAHATWYPAPDNSQGSRPLRILSATDEQAIRPLIEDFQARHPDTDIEYLDMDSPPLSQAVPRAVPPGKSDCRPDHQLGHDLQIKTGE
ncbi:MAG: hypothetical protein R3E95_05415 [Thiolinea sp.]